MSYDENTIRKWLRPTPCVMTIETTTRCNGNCVICGWKYINRKNIDSAVDDLLDTVRQGIDIGIRAVSINHMGEPTLHPQYVEVLSRLDGLCHGGIHHLHLYHYTNGSRLGVSTVSDAILKCLDEVRISIDGTTHEEMKATRPGLNPQVVERGVISLWEKKIATGAKTKIMIRKTTLPGMSNVEFKKKWGKFCNSVAFMPLINDVETKPCHYRHSNPCGDLFTLIAVNVNRNVVACCRDYSEQLTFGNLKNRSLKDIWYGEIATAYRRLHLEGRSHEIKRCSICPAPKNISIK